MTFKIEISQSYDEVNPNDGNETKSDVFPVDMFKSDVMFFFLSKTLKYFNDFQNRNFSVL